MSRKQFDAAFARLAERIDERLRTNCTDWDGRLHDDQFTLPVITAELNASKLREVVEAALIASKFNGAVPAQDKALVELRAALAALFEESEAGKNCPCCMGSEYQMVLARNACMNCTAAGCHVDDYCRVTAQPKGYTEP